MDELSRLIANVLKPLVSSFEPNVAFRWQKITWLICLNLKDSEACRAEQVRFSCPRQNEPRNFIYCCSMPESNQPVCCADPSRSVHEQVKVRLTSESRLRELVFQVMIICYLCLVFGLIIVDYFSHRRLDPRRDPEYVRRASQTQRTSQRLKTK